jgi:hypothetical protein
MLTFVSSPYSSPDPAIEHQRYLDACAFSAWLWQQGRVPFSPIAHWHPIVRRHHLPGNAMAWINYNRAMVERSDALIVLCLDGWRDSLGVAYEVEWAKDRPVTYATLKGQNAYAISSRPPYL